MKKKTFWLLVCSGESVQLLQLSLYLRHDQIYVVHAVVLMLRIIKFIILKKEKKSEEDDDECVLCSVHVDRRVVPLCECDHTHVLDTFPSLLMAMQRGQCGAEA